MEVTVSHYLPGRVRLHVPELARKAALAEAALAWLRTQPGISTARLNEACASLVIEYDRAYEPTLQRILTHLRGVSSRELATFVAASAGVKPEAGVSPRAVPSKPVPKSAAPTKGEVPGLFSSESPLGLPTLSLLMAFSANPFVVAVNMPLMLWNAYPIALRAWRVLRREGRLNIDFLDALAITASLLQGNPMAGAIVTWLIKLGDWIRDLTCGSVRPGADGADGELALADHGGGECGSPLAAGDRKPFTGDGLLVDGSEAFDDLAIDWDHLAGVDHDQIAGR